MDAATKEGNPQVFVSELLKSEKIERCMTRVRKHLTKGPTPFRGTLEWTALMQAEIQDYETNYVSDGKAEHLAKLVAIALEAMQQYTT